MRLRDKVAIVTGGAVGIGRAICEGFAREGASVVVADISEAAGRAAAEAIGGAGGNACFVQTDVSSLNDALHMVAVAVATFGHLNILVNNAALYTRGDVVATTVETWNRLLSVNLTGVFLCCKAAVPALRQGGGGAIVNISSSVGWHDAAPNIVAYAASKFGVTGLTKAMACDHLRDHIRVNCICPGPTDTPLIRASRTAQELQAFVDAQPIGRLGSPHEIAAAAVFLASDEASFVTGVAFPVDGGQTAQV